MYCTKCKKLVSTTQHYDRRGEDKGNYGQQGDIPLKPKLIVVYNCKECDTEIKQPDYSDPDFYKKKEEKSESVIEEKVKFHNSD